MNAKNVHDTCRVERVFLLKIKWRTGELYFKNISILQFRILLPKGFGILNSYKDLSL